MKAIELSGTDIGKSIESDSHKGVICDIRFEGERGFTSAVPAIHSVLVDLVDGSTVVFGADEDVLVS